MLFFKFRYVLVTVFRCGNSDLFICYIEYSSKSMVVHTLKERVLSENNEISENEIFQYFFKNLYLIMCI